MFVLGLDLETTGLNREEDCIIEIGAVVWDTKHNKPVAMMNHLIKRSNIKLESIIVDLTGITDTDLENFGIDEIAALTELIKLASKCSYVVAHNGNSFDKTFLDRALRANDMKLDLPWVDTMYDVPYKANIQTRKLTYLAAEHSYVNPFSHRALFDVLTMLKVCSEYDWNNIIELSKSPMVTVIANVSYDENSKAKRAGFRWNSKDKRWQNEIKQCQLELSNFDFHYEILD